MNQKKIFFDTNVLIYAHDRASSFHTDSASLLKLVFTRQVKGIIAEQNIIELYRVLTNSVAMRRILDPSHNTKLETLERSLLALGKRPILYVA